jgi:hypothetical protein
VAFPEFQLVRKLSRSMRDLFDARTNRFFCLERIRRLPIRVFRAELEADKLTVIATGLSNIGL